MGGVSAVALCTQEKRQFLMTDLADPAVGDHVGDP
jgi:hypothetical protein